jgi:exodeoxyribonuclease VII small subunit
MSKKTASTEPKGYVEALREIKAIVQEIDSNDVDIDVLESKLKRASYLISWCNDRITATEVVVEEIVADMRPMTSGADQDEDLDEDDDFEDDDDFDEDDEEDD